MPVEVDGDTSPAAGVVKEVKIEDLATMVGNMNRFLALLASVEAFADAKLSLADWLVLCMVSSQKGTTSKKLAKALGLAQQRANQIVDRLKDRQLLSPGDQTGYSLSISEDGNNFLQQLNAGLLDLLRPAVSGNERSFFAVGRHLLPLIKIMAAAKPAGED